MNKTILATTVASLLTHSSLLLAQEQQADETMVVTANRFEQSVIKTNATVDIVTKQQLDDFQIKSLTDALALMPGVQVVKNGGQGQSSSVYIRGSASNHIVVLYNGVRIGSATTGSANFSAIPLSGVERIELVKGARAAVYGADAIGGVINIISSSHVDKDSGKVVVGAGSNGYQQGAASVSSKLGESAWINVGINSEFAEGFDVGGTGPVQPDKDGFRKQDISLELGVTIKPNLTAKFIGFHHSGTNDYESYESNGKLSPDELETNLYSYAAVLDYKTRDYSSAVSVSTSRDDSDNKGGEFPGSHLVTDRYALNWLNSYNLNDQVLLQGGAELSRDSVAKSQIWDTSSNSYKSYDATSRNNRALFGSTIIDLSAFQVELSARHDNNESYGSNTTWQVGIGYHVNDTLRLIASSGTAFQAPTYNSLYWPGYGNSDLKPEESLNSELGVEVRTDYADFRLVGYSNIIKNLINYQSKGEELKNSDATIKGVELSSNFETGVLLHSVSFDYLHHNNKVDLAAWGQPADVQDKKLARRANFVAKWLVSYEYQDWRGDLSYQYQGKRFDDAKNTVELDPYSLVNLAVSYQFNDSWAVKAKVDNLLDEEYQTAYQYNTQRRAYYLNATYQF